MRVRNKPLRLGKDQHGFIYYLMPDNMVQRQWPDGGGVSDSFCSLEEWKSGRSKVLDMGRSGKYVFGESFSTAR